MYILSPHTMKEPTEKYLQILSHDLKNPITTISLYLEVLLEKLETEKNTNTDVVKKIQIQVQRLTQLIDNMAHTDNTNNTNT